MAANRAARRRDAKNESAVDDVVYVGSSSMNDEQATQLEFRVPPELEAGTYANLVGVWHTPHEFTLDFSVTLPAAQGEDGAVVMPCQVVARVKIAPSLIFDVLRTLNENMTNYERSFGEIRRPQPPEAQQGGQDG